MVTIYRFRVFNSIGNTFNIGRMCGTKAQVEEYCKKLIQEAKKNSPTKWSYEIDLLEIHRKRFNNEETKKKSI